jgi:Copper type II ascorbate-dependent monooxygenase, C-terminal domain
MQKLGWLALIASLAPACADDGNGTREDTGSALDGGEHPSTDAGAGTSEVTYWKDMVPLFEQHCLQCHQAGGIGPVRLDLYAEAKEHAALIGYSTMAREMPPWHATSDGSCGDFRDSLALDDEQIALIAAWVQGGAKEGAPGRVDAPALDRLPRASAYALPNYAPVAQGGALAQNDDYHCFLLDADVTSDSFIAGYDIAPGVPEIVHHVLVSVVDPAGPAEEMLPAGTTNAQVMAALDAESPDDPGWPCFGQAGEGVRVRSLPVVWAPGQGVVRFPGDSGAPLRPTDKLVVQVHYNLADPAQRGKADATSFRLELAQQVQNIAIFALPDALLESLFGPEPDSLEPGRASVIYSFSRSVQELELEDAAGAIDEQQLSALELWGVMPHMHERGHKLRMRVQTDAASAMSCAVDVQRWDFHWQRMYFYEQPWQLNADSQIEISCDYDTRTAQTPVTPGWGTGNEMCLATLFFTVPAR